jgi:hypothetical protein
MVPADSTLLPLLHKLLTVSHNRVKELSVILILTLMVLISYSQDKKNTVRFDGVYQTAPEIDTADNDTTWNYLRFYEDGTVISVSASGAVEHLAPWFTVSETKSKTDWQQNPSKGHYKVRGNKIHFTITSKQGSIVYKGSVLGETKLVLHYKSLITGDKGKEVYYFVKADLNQHAANTDLPR